MIKGMKKWVAMATLLLTLPSTHNGWNVAQKQQEI